jgi:hypothetical protein
MAAITPAELAQATRARFVGAPKTDFAQWDEPVRVVRVEPDGRVLVVTDAEERLLVAPDEGYFIEADGPLPAGVATSELAPGPAVAVTEQGGGTQ